MAERTTRKDLDQALAQLKKTLGIPESEGWYLDCYHPDGTNRCVVVDANGWRPLGESRRPMRELRSAFALAINASYRQHQYH